MSYPILDNHIHLHPAGRNVDALRDFYRAGGTHVVLSHLPYETAPIRSGEDFAASYRITLDLAERCRAAVPVQVLVTVGPYPVLLIGLAEKLGMEAAIETMKQGMEEAQRLVLEGLASGIGEIGRPHFPVSPEILEASNEIMRYGMSLAKEAGCPVVLHTESVTPDTMENLGRIADAAGLDRSMVIKHYSPPLVREEENHGLFPSILASRGAIAEALSKGRRFLMETDFLDDKDRPGAVMAITTVPKRTKALLQSGAMSEEDAWLIHHENPEKLYGVKLCV
jgi:TatD-related deoxyribonuclease